MAGWNLRHGSWWMLQWSLDRWFSLGFHIDLKRRRDQQGRCYGPYLDIHLGCLIVSIGCHPAYSGDLEQLVSTSRGGLRVNNYEEL